MNILTWNMQGYTATGDKPNILDKLLNNGFYDVVCVQEATQPLGSFKYVNKINNIEVYKMKVPYHIPRTSNNITNYSALYYPWGNGNLRCSLVTYVKNFTIADPCGFHNSPFKDARPMLWVSHEGWFIGNIHLISGNSAAAFKQFENFRDAMRSLPGNPPFCIIGDYNIDALTEQNIREEKKFYYVQEATQISGGCLDYMYAEQWTPMKLNKIDEPGKYSDHSPVLYTF